MLSGVVGPTFNEIAVSAHYIFFCFFYLQPLDSLRLDNRGTWHRCWRWDSIVEWRNQLLYLLRLGFYTLEQGCSTGSPGAGCGPSHNFIRPPETLPV